ncbi:hypothetical protein PMAYCL1PPCAC_26121 [Pristionchus mayeri]|uniref:Saposin B-type domain-containing protein n=1 Tax=Pristionchus mayeri TaxID=1317129 RepID=A0AAN5D342_9BILA|nr:hypothetical protein PMAYCL1PPCAC_26121 [Pristionchus mayeri]
MLRVLVFSSLLLAASAVVPNAPETRKLFCDACERIVGGIEEGVESHEPNILKHCENLCDDILGPLGDLAQECKDWIDKDFAEIMNKLENDWTPERICKDYHLC